MKCWECNGLGSLHDHHVVPRSRGGTRTVPLCQDCHGKAHHRNKRMSTSELTRDALAYKKEQGQRVGSIPYGYTVAADGRTLVEDQAERRAIELIQALRAEGMSLRAIAARLEAEGLRPRGRRWYAKTVANILEARRLERYHGLPGCAPMASGGARRHGRGG